MLDMLKKSNKRQFNSDWKCEGMEFHLVGTESEEV